MHFNTINSTLWQGEHIAGCLITIYGGLARFRSYLADGGLLWQQQQQQRRYIASSACSALLAAYLRCLLSRPRRRKGRLLVRAERRSRSMIRRMLPGL